MRSGSHSSSGLAQIVGASAQTPPMAVQDLDANLVGKCFRFLRNCSDPRERPPG
jgi:hypothetical protein